MGFLAGSGFAGAAAFLLLPFGLRRLSGRGMLHAVQVTLESIDMDRPEAAERSQPVVHFLKRSRLQPVETALGVHRGFHEAGLAQHSQVLRHRRLRHIEPTLDFSHRLLARDQEAQDRPTVWLRNDIEDRFHSLCIPLSAYTCQGIKRAMRDLIWECGSSRIPGSRVYLFWLTCGLARSCFRGRGAHTLADFPCGDPAVDSPGL